MVGDCVLNTPRRVTTTWYKSQNFIARDLIVPLNTQVDFDVQPSWEDLASKMLASLTSKAKRQSLSPTSSIFYKSSDQSSEEIKFIVQDLQTPDGESYPWPPPIASTSISSCNLQSVSILFISLFCLLTIFHQRLILSHCLLGRFSLQCSPISLRCPNANNPVRRARSPGSPERSAKRPRARHCGPPL